jgi:hypothetical protein
MSKAESNPTNLVVWANDGARVAYALTEEPKVTFTETDLIITTTNVEVNYTLDNMARFTYESDENVNLIDIKTEEMVFKLRGESLLFPALKANSTVSVYSLNGTLVLKKNIQVTGEYFFPLATLNTGVYVVTVNGISYKVVKK